MGLVSHSRHYDYILLDLRDHHTQKRYQSQSGGLQSLPSACLADIAPFWDQQQIALPFWFLDQTARRN